MRLSTCFSFVAVAYVASRTVSGFTAQGPRRGTSARAAAVRPGDTVVVVGGTGGVGQLVTKKLRNQNEYKVRVTSRNVETAKETIDDKEVEVVAVDLISEDSTSALKAAMNGASALVISVGTTAFPTKRWKGGNNPKAIDEEAVKRIASVAKEISGLKRVVLLTSVGVDRTGEMPFLILNLFGVLDAKKSGEAAIISASESGNFEYAIVRPGRLVGGPYTNLDVAKLLQIEGGKKL